jgi:hypothetical protein
VIITNALCKAERPGPEMILVNISRSNALFTMADECSSAEAEVQIHLIKYLVPISF